MSWVLPIYRTPLSAWIQYRRFPEYVVYTANNSLRLLSISRLVDLTMNASMDLNTNDSAEYSISPSEDATNLGDEERGLASRSTRISPLSVTSRTSSASNAEETELQTRRQSESVVGSIRRKTSQLLEVVTPSTSTRADPAPVNPKLVELLDAYTRSEIASSIREEGEALKRSNLNRQAESGASAEIDPSQQLPDVAEETTLLRGRKGASWGTQFRILSGRAFKNLYRDPALLTAHYLASIVLAGASIDCCLEMVLMSPLHTYTVMCGLFFRHVT